MSSAALSSGVVLAAVLLLRPLLGLVLLTQWGRGADLPSPGQGGAPREQPLSAGSRN